MTPSNDTFFGDKLRLARLLNGSTQQELGEFASVTRQFIHQLESGSKQPADDVLGALCEALRVNKEFFKSAVGNDVKFEQCHFRKRRTTPVGIAQRVLAFSTIFETLIFYINSVLDLPPNNIPLIEDILNIQSKNDNYTNSEIERAAEYCRKYWKLGLNTPLSKMTRVLERAGIVITHFEGVSDKVDALSLNRKYPIIVRNRAKESICRMRFDLAHECGHFILHDGVQTGDKITENEADRFASSFIFPRGAFVKEFPNMSGSQMNWKVIYSLKIRWGMSARAIIYRANQLGLITAQQYRSANVYLNKSGQAKHEKYDDQISPETPELLEKAILVMRDDLGISFSHISKKLGITQKLLTEISGVTPTDDNHLQNVVPLKF